jgi:hypothetical protein
LGKTARVMPTAGTVGDTPATIGYIIGQNKGLVAGNAYVLTVEYPDDVPRSMYIVNRGSDYLRGVATGTTIGDARQQFTECSPESMNYPQTGQWQVYRQYFHLLDRFQGVVGKKDPAPGYRPYTPNQGFYVAITRMKALNDPRNQGAATGYIRLYAVTNPSTLYAPINYPPSSLPRRSIFWREEMSDGLLASTGNPNDFAVSDSVNWYLYKMKMAKILGINTFSKDLLEFGFNQGWETGDQNWAMNAQAPNVDLWTRLVPKATAEGFNLMPYFEYKGSIGLNQQYVSFGSQRRAQKLYHGIKYTNGSSYYYDSAWWTQDQNADITDPETLVDAKHMLDRTVGDFKTRAKFNGIWFRMRSNCLPMSFAPNTIARFNAETSNTATQATLITSYEGTKTLYNQYVSWWYGKRKVFLLAMRDYLRNTIGIAGAQVLYTPWTSEAVPALHEVGAPFGHMGVITDDTTGWWTTYKNSLPEGWWKYQWNPTSPSQVLSGHLYQMVLGEQLPILNSPNNQEFFHGSPTADPQNYAGEDGVMMTYPMGRLFALDDVPLLNSYRCTSGMTAIRHYTLNEDNGEEPSPFAQQLGYLSVACDRAGNHLMLQQARAVANGDPTNLAYLEASSLSTGFPEIMRKFNQAFLSLPALSSALVTGTGAPSNTAVVMRQITTPSQGTYVLVVNTSMSKVTGVTMTLPGTGTVKELVTNQTLASPALNLTLESAELRTYRVGP